MTTPKKEPATGKKSFLLYKDFYETLGVMSNEQGGILFKAIYEYQHNGTIEEVPPELVFLFKQLVSQFKRDDCKYNETCKKRSIAGIKGAKQKLANAGKRKHKLANQADSDSDSDSDSDKPIPLSGGEYTVLFNSFWEIYPKKKKKAEAFRAWKRIPGRPQLDILSKAIARQKKNDQWKKDNGQFIPYPASWLNGASWLDEEPVENKSTSTGVSAGFVITGQKYINGKAVKTNSEGESAPEFRARKSAEAK